MELLLINFLFLSYIAAAMILIVIVIRKLFSKAPATLFCMLWMLVGLSLILPASVSTGFGLIPAAPLADLWKLSASRTAMADNSSQKHSGTEKIVDKKNSTIQNRGNSGMGQNKDMGFADHNADSGVPNTLKNAALDSTGKDAREDFFTEDFPSAYFLTSIFTAGQIHRYFGIWLFGVLGMLLYYTGNLIYFRLLLADSIPEPAIYEGASVRIYRSDRISSPFLFGIFAPKIYLPFALDKEHEADVLVHERMHLARWDHVKKSAAFLILSVYWFHPLVWLAFWLYAKDIELACDERALQNLSKTERAHYAHSLLSCAGNGHRPHSCLVGFVETDMKQRIAHVLSYRKPSKWVWTAGAMIVLSVGLCFSSVWGAKLTINSNGLEGDESNPTDVNSTDGEGAEPVDLQNAVEAWAEAFCRCDSEAIRAMKTENTEVVLNETPISLQSDIPAYEVVSVDNDGQVTILYFVKASDSWLEVQEEKLRFEKQDDSWKVANEKLYRYGDAGYEADLTMELFLAIVESKDFEAFVLEQTTQLFGQFTNIRKGQPEEGVIDLTDVFKLSYGEYHYSIYIDYDMTSNDQPSNINYIEVVRNKSAECCFVFWADTPDNNRYGVETGNLREFLSNPYSLVDSVHIDVPKGYHYTDYHADIWLHGGHLLYKDSEIIETDHGSDIIIDIIPHGESAAAGWYSSGGFGEFKDMEDLNWRGNHMWQIGDYEQVDGCIGNAVLGEYEFELFTSPEWEEYKKAAPEASDEEMTSRYWYVFITTNQSEDGLLSGYMVWLDASQFSKEETIRLARSIEPLD